MNTIAKTWLVVLLVAVATPTMTAQSDNRKSMNREHLAEAQARHIASKLGLDDGTTEKYVAAFCDYQKEVWALGPRTEGKKKAEMTDAETDQAIKSRFERSEKILSIRQKYYKRYSQFLSPKQIDRAYKLERDAMKRLSKHGKKGQRASQKTGKPASGKKNRR